MGKNENCGVGEEEKEVVLMADMVSSIRWCTRELARRGLNVFGVQNVIR